VIGLLLHKALFVPREV